MEGPGNFDKSGADEGLTGMGLRDPCEEEGSLEADKSAGRGIPLALARVEHSWDAGPAHTRLPTPRNAKLF